MGDKKLNTSQKDLLIQYEEMLRVCDWYYFYSDDHSVWTKGIEQDEKRRELLKIIDKAGIRDEAYEIYKRYCPYEAS